jgi:excisionase family DNA binding protein
MPDEILTLPDVARLLRVAEKTVYTMAQRGGLPAFKVGGQWRFKRVDLDHWIEERKQSVQPAARRRNNMPKNSAPRKARTGK